MPEKPSSLIINSPYSEPDRHWLFVEGKEDHQLKEGRRKAGYMIADPRAKLYQDKGKFVPLPLANQIRPRVSAWRNANYPGATSISKALLEHWQDKEQRMYPFFFCQIEAIETLIWLLEAPDADKTGIDIPSDGGEFQRLCCKLATGTGKTVVMAMLIVWQVINKLTYPQDTRFSKNVLVVAPGLTVKNRLSVLRCSDKNNYYDEFGIVPISMRERLRRGKVLVHNWHVLNRETAEQIEGRKSVDKRGAKSDEAFTREALGEMANARNLIVINDEAHHAWRVSAESSTKGIDKSAVDEATKWIGGLDCLHKTRGILRCFDFSATPFVSSGKKAPEESMFGWIVSDFGLNDAIEAGLVKTPRIVVRDDTAPDSKTRKSRLYHIYSDPEVKDDLNRRANVHEPLPDLLTNAYTLLGEDWEETKSSWSGSKLKTPPVMITVANRTETAARVKYAFDNNKILIDSLCEEEGILHIDSKALKKAEEEELESGAESADGQKVTKKQSAEALREQVNTVGQEGKPGEKIQNVISVGMLSEGWDARTVTQIMGLRAFTSQLLCEQVVGRGLRRASYDLNEETGLFDAEYVNVFGVPFSFLPHEKGNGDPIPVTPKITVMPVEEKKEFAIEWPNIIRIERIYKPHLEVDWEKTKPLSLDASAIPEIAELAPTVDNKPNLSQIKDINLEGLMRRLRKQTLIFRAAQDVWASQKPSWEGSRVVLMAELVRLMEQFLDSDRIRIEPELFHRDKKRRRLVIALCMSKVTRHFWQAISYSNTEKMEPVFDSNPIRSTGDMRPWRTGKPCEPAKRSHINYCVYDSTWEASDAFELDRNEAVAAWVKNDHLGFSVFYVYNGVVKKYLPDFLVRLAWGDLLVLETKGQQSEQDDAKHSYMEDWVKAVNQHGSSGRWLFRVVRQPKEIKGVLEELAYQHQNQR